MENSEYIGKELDLFKLAKNWKNYWIGIAKKYISSSVLEVGAGIGGTTTALLSELPNSIRWTALEPDQNLAKELKNNTKHLDNVRVKCGTIRNIEEHITYNSILYIDVIEHIENDREELILASNKLKPNGHLIILVPAHNYLFSPFDKAIGHYRRYNKKSLLNTIPKDLEILECKYLDSTGLFLSLGNKWLLKQSQPTESQVAFWDNYVVPISTFVDKILRFRYGKSLILIAKKNESL